MSGGFFLAVVTNVNCVWRSEAQLTDSHRASHSLYILLYIVSYVVDAEICL